MFSLQDKDLKQYLDDCGNIIHVHNVKVRQAAHLWPHLLVTFSHCRLINSSLDTPGGLGIVICVQ